MNKTWLLIIIFLVLMGFWYKSTQTPPAKNAPLLNQKGSFEVTTQKVKYFEQTEGFLAKPQNPGSYPGVVMIHDRLGLNDHLRAMAKLLASYGYKVLAVDLYNRLVVKTDTEAQKQIGSLDAEKAILNLKAAADYLRKNESTPKIAVLGWNFGGDESLKLSLSGEKLEATVIYYGNLLLDARKLQLMTWPVLGVFGDKDTVVPVESARVFDKVLTQLKTPHEILIYPGVGHDFTNPSSLNYSAKEALDAWTKTVQFLEKNLKK